MTLLDDQLIIAELSATPVGGHYLNPSAATQRGFCLKSALLIDGGHLRALVRRTEYNYDPQFIERTAHACFAEAEVLFRIFYYDCPPFRGEVRLPVSGERFAFDQSDAWLLALASKDWFAVRRGVLKFRGFTPKQTPISGGALCDQDFRPNFEQKGVDMRIGLDIARFCETKAVGRILLITNDTDCIPAMKFARIAGLQVGLVSFPSSRVAPDLLRHADFHRSIEWPA